MKTKFTWILIMTIFYSIHGFSQTIVSTSPQNRKAVLEEFTGMNCGFCPRGHEIAESLKQQYGDDFYAISVHQGSLSVPNSGQTDFRTPYGDSLANRIGGVTAYPSGIVNRYDFDGVGATSYLSSARTKWSGMVADILTQSSPVNIGVSTTFYPHNRTLEVYTELYYTADGVGEDFIHILLLENKVDYQQDYQNGAQTSYLQKHILRMPVTPIAGEVVSQTTRGSVYSKTFTVTVPAEYVIDSTEVVAFVGDSYHNVYNATSQKAANFATSVSAVTSQAPSLIIYPNPARESVTIELGQEGVDSEIQIYNVQGQVVKQVNASSSRLNVEVNDLPSGIYIVQLVQGDRKEIKRFIRQ